MTKVEINPGHWETDVKKSAFRLYCWTGAWVISIGLLGIGSRFIWNFNTSVTVFMVLINVAIGIGMILANIRFVKGLDEMQRRIFLEAAALTLGVTLVFGGSYQLWGDLKLISFEPQVWHMVGLMGLINIVGTITAPRRYR